MNSLLSQTRYSAEEYLVMERKALTKSEFRDGEIFAMTGASRKHNLIAVNIASELRTQLKNRPCEAYLGDMRVKAAQARSYHYPDISVTCGVPEFEDAHVDTLINPTLLIEILSPSTEAYDRGGKFTHYRKINSLREYLLVTQDYPSVERYALQEAGWVLTEIVALEDSVTLESIGCVLKLSEIYDKVSFEALLENTLFPPASQ